MFKTISKLLLGLGLVLSSYSLALAGGSASNLFLVVNSNREDSKTIANHYISLRNIPASHVLYYDWTHDDAIMWGSKTKGGYGSCSIVEFRPLLKTITDTITERKLNKQIDYVVYSTDFPWQVRLKGETWEKPRIPIVEYATADDYWNSLNEETQAAFVEFFGGGDLATAKAVVFTKHQEEVTKSKIPQQIVFSLSNSYIASTTGLTFLYQTVQNKNIALVESAINWYHNRGPKRGPAYLFDVWRHNPIEIQTHGFRHNYSWIQPGDLTEHQLVYYPETQNYFLSVMLGVTDGPKNDQRGNTVDEIISYLTRSVGADATKPSGTFYFMKIVTDPPGRHTATRSYTRDLLYSAKSEDEDPRVIADGGKYAVERLIDLGINAKEETIPYSPTTTSPNRMPEEDDILGVIVGTFQPVSDRDSTTDSYIGEAPPTNKGDLNSRWGSPEIDITGRAPLNLNDSTLLPGAIVDNLTSYGGMLRRGMTAGSTVSQPPITYYLAHGAAGACGTVVEPMNIFAKFPWPLWPEYYVKGASMAEALYQSIAQPYQMSILGDPLCQPWADPPEIEITGLSESKLSGTVTITLKEKTAGTVRLFELHIDGRLFAQYKPSIGTGDTGEYKETKIELDTTKLTNGYHEIDIVAVSIGSSESQQRTVHPFIVDNNDDVLEFLTSATEISVSQTLTLTASQTGTTSIKFFQNYREIGEITGESGTVTIDASMLGKGPTTIQAKSYGTNPMFSQPIPITVN